MTDARAIRVAEDDVEQAKREMVGTIRDITRQLQPHHLVAELWEDAKIKGADLAEEAVDAVKARPIAATGIVAALALFFAREPLMGMAGKILKGSGEKRAQRKSARSASKSVAKKPAAKPATKSNVSKSTHTEKAA